MYMDRCAPLAHGGEGRVRTLRGCDLLLRAE